MDMKGPDEESPSHKRLNPLTLTRKPSYEETVFQFPSSKKSHLLGVSYSSHTAPLSPFLYPSPRPGGEEDLGVPTPQLLDTSGQSRSRYLSTLLSILTEGLLPFLFSIWLIWPESFLLI